VLSDPKKRSRYDQFGDDGEDEDFGSGDWIDAYEYYRAMHPEVTKTDIKTFAERYRHSDEEQTDLLDFYEEHGGDITALIECIMCSSNDDVPRFVEFFEG
jgi:DnaJ family protein C protein 9